MTFFLAPTCAAAPGAEPAHGALSYPVPFSAWYRAGMKLSPNPHMEIQLLQVVWASWDTQDTARLELLTQEWVQFAPHTPQACSLHVRPLQQTFLLLFLSNLLQNATAHPEMRYPDQV